MKSPQSGVDYDADRNRFVARHGKRSRVFRRPQDAWYWIAARRREDVERGIAALRERGHYR